MGLSLPNSSSNMSLSKEKFNETGNIGNAIKNLMELDLKPNDILTKESFLNAIKMLYIVGGSTNAVIHLLAIANLTDVNLSLRDFQELEDIPVLTNMKPHGEYVMDDLSKIGGTSVLIKYLIEIGILNGSCLTVTGKTLYQNVVDYDLPTEKSKFYDLIHPIDKPFKSKSHISILNGNLAPNGCISKVSSKFLHALHSCDFCFLSSAL